MPSSLHSIEHLLPQNSALKDHFTHYSSLMMTTRLLARLCSDMQQHRGATMGVLSGQPAFTELATRLSRSIDRLLTLLNDRDSVEYSMEQKHQLQAIFHEWKVIQLGWQQDQLMHNFEFHSHVIDQLLHFLRICQRQLQDIALGSSRTSEHEANQDAYLQTLIEACCQQIPQCTETLARLRGLCTNVAVLKACGEDNHGKISFLLGKAREENQQIANLGKDPNLARSIQCDYRKEFKVFADGIQKSILKSRAVRADSSKMFNSATRVIDQLWTLSDFGLHTCEQLLLEQLIDGT